MLTFITLIAVGVLSFLGATKLQDKSEFTAFICGVVLFFDILAIIVLPLDLINRNARFEYQIERYNNVQQMVEEYNSLPDSSAHRIESLEADIRDKILDVNNTIAEHKVMSKSLWTGPWYSEKVGNLPKLSLNGK